MTSTILTIGIPTLAVLLGILLNRNDANRLDSRMTALETSIRGEMNALRSQWHTDVVALLNVMRDHDVRLARVEEHN